MGIEIMNDYLLFKNVYHKLFRWIMQKDYYGYDPYDGINSKHFKKKKGNKLVGFLWIQFHKMCPFNLRPFFYIQKTVGPKAMGLITQALLKEKIENSHSEIEKLLSHIYSKSLKSKYGLHFWSPHNFNLYICPFPWIIEYVATDTPSIIGSNECATAFLEYYKKSGEFKDVIIDVKDFILKELFQNNPITFIKYTPTTPLNLITYNASAIGFSYLVRVNKIIQDPKIPELSKNFFDFLISQQNSDGSWGYAIDLKTGKKRNQIDFHQGYILDSLYDFIKYTQQWDDKHYKSLLIGAKFFKEKQFYSDGRCRYRYPRTWPIDIHNQAQGIITFSKLSEIEGDYLEFAKKIAKWTIENMRDERGYFYYQKWPFLTNKIPYMRWGQAWMMLALATLLEAMDNE